MNPFVKFMQTPAGRAGRILAGTAMLAAGALGAGGTAGYAVAVLGTLPIASGVFDICMLAPFFRLPLSGAKIRAMYGA